MVIIWKKRFRIVYEYFINKENVNLLTLGFEFKDVLNYRAMIAPISMAGSRLGTLFVYRCKDPFSIDDIILTEYSTTVIGLAMQRAE